MTKKSLRVSKKKTGKGVMWKNCGQRLAPEKGRREGMWRFFKIGEQKLAAKIVRRGRIGWLGKGLAHALLDQRSPFAPKGVLLVV